MDFKFVKVVGHTAHLEVGVEYKREVDGIFEVLLLEVAPFHWGQKTLMKVQAGVRYPEGNEASAVDALYADATQGLKVSAGQVAKKYLRDRGIGLPPPPPPKRRGKAAAAAAAEEPTPSPAVDDRQLSLPL